MYVVYGVYVIVDATRRPPRPGRVKSSLRIRAQLAGSECTRRRMWAGGGGGGSGQLVFRANQDTSTRRTSFRGAWKPKSSFIRRIVKCNICNVCIIRSVCRVCNECMHVCTYLCMHACLHVGRGLAGKQVGTLVWESSHGAHPCQSIERLLQNISKSLDLPTDAMPPGRSCIHLWFHICGTDCLLNLAASSDVRCKQI